MADMDVRSVYWHQKNTIELLETELTASQAREKVLLGLVTEMRNVTCEPRIAWLAIDALAQPTDDSSLKAALAAERERVAKHFELRSYLGSGYELAVEIRALGDEK